jgi:hypothetical protein
MLARYPMQLGSRTLPGTSCGPFQFTWLKLREDRAKVHALSFQHSGQAVEASARGTWQGGGAEVVEPASR